MEIVTNLFMGNALMESELRPSSFKGLFRWWFRVGGGSFEDEKRLFGWTGTESRRGLVNIRIKEQSITKGLFSKNFQSTGGRYAISGSGINYIGFALDERFKENQRGKRRRQYLQGKFTLEILFHPMAKEEDIKKLLAVLWLSTNLGNFGTRSRRCFGSLRVRDIKGELPHISLKFHPDFGNLKKWIRDNMNEIMKIMGNSPRPHIPHISSFEIYRIEKENWKNYNRWIREVQRGREGKYLVKKWHKGSESAPFKSPMDMCDFMGFLLNAYRSYYEPDYSNVKSALNTAGKNVPSIDVERSVFGLPLPFYFSSIRRKGAVHLHHGSEKARRASPLILKVIGDKRQFEGMIIFMPSDFKPSKSQLFLWNEEKENKRIITSVGYPNFSVIGNFLNTLGKYDLIERIY